jgi:hypothetical protein
MFKVVKINVLFERSPMSHMVFLFVFLVLLIIAAVFLIKKLIPQDSEDDSSVKIKQVGKIENQPEAPLPDAFDYNEPRANTNSGRKSFAFMPLVLVMVVGYLLYENHSLIAAKVPASIAAITSEPQKQTISVANVIGHEVVDGVNWIQIIATGATGIPFEGWVSELAVQKQPPKENKMADEFMKKLGLPTNKERLEGIKALRKVGSALDTSLKDFRPKTN